MQEHNRIVVDATGMRSEHLWIHIGATATPVWFGSVEQRIVIATHDGCKADAMPCAKGARMDDEDLKRRLDALGATVPVSSKIARLRVLFDSIEAAFLRGATRRDVLAVLNDDGFDMTMASFKSALQRIRAERKAMQADAALDATEGTSGVEAANTNGPMGESMAAMFAKRTFRSWDGRR